MKIKTHPSKFLFTIPFIVLSSFVQADVVKFDEQTYEDYPKADQNILAPRVEINIPISPQLVRDMVMGILNNQTIPTSFNGTEIPKIVRDELNKTLDAIIDDRLTDRILANKDKFIPPILATIFGNKELLGELYEKGKEVAESKNKPVSQSAKLTGIPTTDAEEKTNEGWSTGDVLKVAAAAATGGIIVAVALRALYDYCHQPSVDHSHDQNAGRHGYPYPNDDYKSSSGSSSSSCSESSLSTSSAPTEVKNQVNLDVHIHRADGSLVTSYSSSNTGNNGEIHVYEVALPPTDTQASASSSSSSSSTSTTTTTETNVVESSPVATPPSTDTQLSTPSSSSSSSTTTTTTEVKVIEIGPTAPPTNTKPTVSTSSSSTQSNNTGISGVRLKATGSTGRTGSLKPGEVRAYESLPVSSTESIASRQPVVPKMVQDSRIQQASEAAAKARAEQIQGELKKQEEKRLRAEQERREQVAAEQATLEKVRAEAEEKQKQIAAEIQQRRQAATVKKETEAQAAQKQADNFGKPTVSPSSNPNDKSNGTKS